MEMARNNSVCERFGADPSPVSVRDILGLARDFSASKFPINGMRHPSEGGTCGWYIWSSEEMSEDDDFFVPTHVEHLVSQYPEVQDYLSLPAGWRFLIAPGYEDVWYDGDLLDV